ncbi:MAG: ABC transporter ATP-binding protein [Ignavibacteriae bacterium]|nr:ABC transporter ATP-binding protein [Ignavibacteriota bacterium]
MLEIRNLNKNFDGVQAVQDFTLSLQSGKITSLIGPNGAGKTTVFNIVTGFIYPNSGTVTFDNASLRNLPPWKIAQLSISRTFQDLRLFKRLTVLENVLLGRKHQSGERFLNALLNFSTESPEYKDHLAKAISLLEFVGLMEHRSQLTENLSYGQQKLLTIACCLAAEPEMLLLDEPVSGVQPAMVDKIAEILQQLVKKRRKTIFLIEHDMEFVLRISDLVVVMDEGKKITEGNPSVIRSQPEILEAYLS